MELSIDRGRPNAHSNPSAAGKMPGHARGRLIPSEAERLQPTTPLQFLRGATLDWNAPAADGTSQARSRKHRDQARSLRPMLLRCATIRELATQRPVDANASSSLVV